MFYWGEKSESHLHMSHIPRCDSRKRYCQKGYGGYPLCQHGYGGTASFQRLLLCCFWDSWWQSRMLRLWWPYEDAVNDIWPSFSYWSGFVLISSPRLLCSFLHFVNFSPCLGFKPTSGNFEWQWKYYSLSHVQLSVIPWTVACQAPLSMGLSRQE